MLPGIESIGCAKCRFVAQHKPPEITVWIIQPHLHVFRHGPIGPHVDTVARDFCRRTNTTFPIAAGSGPEFSIKKGMDPCGVVHRCTRAQTARFTGIRCPFAPVHCGTLKYHIVGRSIARPRHGHGQQHFKNDGSIRHLTGHIKGNNTPTQEPRVRRAHEDMIPRAIGGLSQLILEQRDIF